MAKLLLGGALMRVAGVFLAEMQLAVRAAVQSHREEASGKRVLDGQAGARRARRCTKGEVLYGRQGDARWERRCTTDKHRRARGAAGT